MKTIMIRFGMFLAANTAAVGLMVVPYALT